MVDTGLLWSSILIFLELMGLKVKVKIWIHFCKGFCNFFTLKPPVKKNPYCHMVEKVVLESFQPEWDMQEEIECQWNCVGKRISSLNTR